jgi:hypothetical protein
MIADLKVRFEVRHDGMREMEILRGLRFYALPYAVVRSCCGKATLGIGRVDGHGCERG